MTDDDKRELEALRVAARDFIEKVESGRARSVDSYRKFKAALERPYAVGGSDGDRTQA